MRTSSRKLGVRSMAVAVTWVAVACGGSDRGGRDAAAAADSALPSTAAAPRTDTVPLTPLDGTKVSGDVRFTPAGDTLRVAVYVRMQTGEADYASHLHSGSCEEPGAVVMPLHLLTAGEMGIAEATTSVPLDTLRAGRPYVVVVHDMNGSMAGCAALPAADR